VREAPSVSGRDNSPRPRLAAQHPAGNDQIPSEYASGWRINRAPEQRRTYRPRLRVPDDSQRIHYDSGRLRIPRSIRRFHLINTVTRRRPLHRLTRSARNLRSPGRTRNREELRRIAAGIEELVAYTRSAELRRVNEHLQLVEILHFIHSQPPLRRERLLELRGEETYERPYTEAEPLISVVIPTYDQHELLRHRSIPSVLAQSYQNFELIVVGDAAPEEARLAVESFDDPRIRFTNLDYRGPYPEDPQNAWLVAGTPPYNEGVDLARGLWIAALDDDDAYRPRHLELLLTDARERHLELVYAPMLRHAPDGTARRIGRFPPGYENYSVGSSLYHHGLARIFQTELADAAFWDPGDWGMCRRMMEAGVRIGMIDEETIDYFPSQLFSTRWERAGSADVKD
jgi:Glycosyl transferase family 2